MPEDKSNPFAPKTKEELEREEQEKQALEKKIKEVAEAAQSCLSDERFIKYRQAVKAAREGLIDVMKRNSEPDPIKFALFCKACLSKIDAWDMIIELVEKDSKKKIGE